MDKEKLHIPFPDERTIQEQINKIVSSGVKQRPSFLTYLRKMYHQIGLRQLFSDRSEVAFALITAITLISFFFIRPDPVHSETNELYGFIFLISPVLFIAFSIYTYSNKISNGTYEVEMSCKYNVYQVIAFRMLMFSIVSILVNLLMISFIVLTYDYVQFLRAFMISNSGLFIFSIVFLYALMKRHTKSVAAAIIVGWITGNLLLIYTNNKLYSDILVNIPLFVYGIVLVLSICVYLKFLNRLILFKHTEGVFEE